MVVIEETCSLKSVPQTSRSGEESARGKLTSQQWNISVSFDHGGAYLLRGELVELRSDFRLQTNA